MGIVGNQSGLTGLVAADGSIPYAVSFPIPYDVAPASIQVTPVVQSPQTELSAQVVSGSVSLAGFQFIVTGGAPGTYTTAYWASITAGSGGIATTAYNVIGGPYTIRVANGNGGSNIYTFLPNDYLGTDPTRYAVAIANNIPLH